jgi:hypothetical protein
MYRVTNYSTDEINTYNTLAELNAYFTALPYTATAYAWKVEQQVDGEWQVYSDFVLPA